MAFLGKNERGEYILDSAEARPTFTELAEAERLFKIWQDGRRPLGEPAGGNCPHEDFPCAIPGGRECLGKIVWWRRYVREIEVAV